MSAPCNFSIPSLQCTIDTCCLKQSILDYRPTLAGNGTYAGLFGAILLAQIIQLVIFYHSTWGFFIGMAAGLILEIIGYAGRILLRMHPFDLNYFIIYLVCLTIGPAFVMASIYICMGHIVVAIGAQHSRLPPRWYALLCVTGDIIALLLQSIGGALAATAVKGESNNSNPNLGTHILIAGLTFQIFSTLVFVVLCADFTFHVRRADPNDRNPAFRELVASRRFKGFLAALALATLTVFIRSCYRVAELSGGFGSSTAQNQTLFMIFEGPMIIVATAALTFFHPGFGFRGTWGSTALKNSKAVDIKDQKEGKEEKVEQGSEAEAAPAAPEASESDKTQ